MERERYSDEESAERETDGKSERDKAREEEQAEAVYGDTDMDPNRDDQRDAHQAGSDEHL